MLSILLNIFFILSLIIPFSPKNNNLITEPEAKWALSHLRKEPVTVNNSGISIDIMTSFYRPLEEEKHYNKISKDQDYVLLFLHGTDSSCLEWRYLIKELSFKNIDCIAIDWWTGGWTDREPFCQILYENQDMEPWTLINQHLYNFCQQKLQNKSIILVGASLGGAIAINFAYEYPDVIKKLILIDSGGESYKSPPPNIVSTFALSFVSIKYFIQRIQYLISKLNKSKLLSLHINENNYYLASLIYFSSGGIEKKVNCKLIQKIKQPTMIIWGERDPILPILDAYKFQEDLQNCLDVIKIDNSGHTPHLDNPTNVSSHILKLLYN